jgi:hypothetical protein
MSYCVDIEKFQIVLFAGRRRKILHIWIYVRTVWYELTRYATPFIDSTIHSECNVKLPNVLDLDNPSDQIYC